MTTKKPDEQPIQTYIEKYDLKADWNYWCKASSWTLFETAHLIHGIDPKKISVQGVDHISRGLRAGDSKIQTALDDYSLLDRAGNDGLLGLRNQPLAALKFCISYQITVPQALLDICILASERQVEATEKMNVNKDAQNPESDKTANAITIKPIGGKKEENLIRLIGILRNMLKDELIISDLKRNPELFKKSGDLTNYISGLYGEDMANKGLSPTALNTTWSNAKKILAKDDEI